MKNIYCIILSIVLMFSCLNVSASAEMIERPVLSEDKTKIHVEGQLGADKAEMKVNLALLFTEENVADFSQPNNIADVLELNADADGKYTYDISFDKENGRVGNYKVYVWAGEDSDYGEFYFANETTELSYLAAVKTAAQGTDDEVLRQKLYDYYGILNIDSAAYMQAPQLSVAAISHETLKPFNGGISDLAKHVRVASAIAILNTGNTAVVFDSKDKFVDTNLKNYNVIKKMNPLFENSVSAQGKKNVVNDVKSKNFTSITAFEKAFADSCFLNAVYAANVSGYGHIEGLLANDDYTSVVGINTQLYDALSPTEKSNVASTLMTNGRVSSITAFQSTLDGLSTPKEGDDDDDNGGGRGGNGGDGIKSSMSVTAPPAESAEKTNSTFSDMAQAQWAEEAVNTLSEKGIVNGVGNGRFEPMRSVTREEFLKMLLSSLNIAQLTTSAEFSDVDNDKWYSGWIAAGAESGIITGREDNTFGVGESISREDCAVMIFRALKLEKATGAVDFTDADSISEYAKDAVSSMKKQGIINGMEDGAFYPNKTCSRAEAAVMLMRVLERGSNR